MKTIRASENLRILIIAVTVGLATGVSVWVFRSLINLFHWLLVERLGESVLAHWLSSTPLDPRLSGVIVLALAGVIVGWVMDRFVGHEKYHGVSSIMVATWLAGGRLPYQKMPFKAVASALSLGAGASVGPEDPSVQIGANVGSFFAQRLNLSDDNIRVMVAAGSAGAIAAAFNAPIAGVFFAIEVILIGDLNIKSSGMVMLAAVISSAFTQSIGNVNPIFGDLQYELGTPLQLPFHLVLGIILAFVSWGVVHYLFWQAHIVHHHLRLPLPVLTGLTGAIVGTIGIFIPQVLGPGEEIMHEVLTGHDEFIIGMLLLIGVMKLIATGLSQSGGFVGGVFAPTLFMGIMFGSAFGRSLLHIPGFTPGIVGDSRAYAIAGMAGLLAGVVQAPITAILLVFELTNDYRLILPIMLTSVAAVFGMNYLNTAGIYIKSLLKDGINLHPERDLDVMQGIAVREAMVSPAYSISQTATLTELRDILRRYKVRSVCVVDERGRLTGIVTLGDLQRIFENNHRSPAEISQITVGDICTKSVTTTHADDKLWQAIQTMGEKNVGRLPVINRLTGELEGVITRRRIIETYNNAIHRKMEEQHDADKIRLSHVTGAHVLEFKVQTGSPIAGKRIRDIDFPASVIIASVYRDSKSIVPRGFTEIKPGDALTIVADVDVVKPLEALFYAKTRAQKLAERDVRVPAKE